MKRFFFLTFLCAFAGVSEGLAQRIPQSRKTSVSIVGEDFHINGRPTYAGRSWQGHSVEGLLLNSRMVQATFDDLNPETAQPIVSNEDDHENFDEPANNFAAAIAGHVSWGWFDYRRKGEALDEGYQSPPVNWGLSSERKRAFFKRLSEITGASNP